MPITEEQRQTIVSSASSVLAASGATEVSLLEGLPDGKRLHISVSVLPPIDESSTGALLMKPEHYLQANGTGET